MRALVVAVTLASMAALGMWGCSPVLTDGRYTCTQTSECPSGYVCGGGRCRSGSGTECRQDVQCVRGPACTAGVCESGYCSYEPDPSQDGERCDDGTFCNGADACQGGRCANVGPAPCDTCNEATDTCSTGCGELGMPCCLGDLCSVGACNAGTCTSCGGLREPCCPPGILDSSLCTAADSECDGTTCVPCGGNGQLCCLSSPRIGFPCQSAADGCDFRIFPAQCAMCGLEGQPCCVTGCEVGLTCVDGLSCVRLDCGGICPSQRVCAPGPMGPECVDCGASGQPCCDDLSCSGGDACVLGLCGFPVEPADR